MSKIKGFFTKHSEIFTIRFFIFLAILVLCVILLATCRGLHPEEATHDTPDPPVDNIDNVPEAPDISISTDEVTVDNISDFVTLGQYKGILFDKITVEQQDIEIFISQHLAENIMFAEVTDRAVQPGDIVIIDYSGSIDGVAFPNGTDHNVELEIGAGRFIPGFEEQIVGHSMGEVFDIYVTFPEAYHAPELAGQEAVFEINLISIYSEQVPELNEEFVRRLGLDSVDEYRQLVRERLEVQARNSEWNQIIDIVIDNAVFHKLPESEIEHHVFLAIIWYQYEAMRYGVDVEELIFYFTNGMSMNDFIENELKPGAEFSVKEDLVIRAIAVQEGIILTDAEFDEGLREIVENTNYDSVEQFMEVYTDVNVLIALLRDRITDLLIGYSTPN